MYVWLSCLSWTLPNINNIQRMLNKDLTQLMQSLPRIHGNRQTERRFCWQGETPYNGGLYGEALPERDTFFRPQVYGRVGILLVKVSKRVAKSVLWVFEKAQKRLTDEFLRPYKVEKRFYI